MKTFRQKVFCNINIIPFLLSKKAHTSAILAIAAFIKQLIVDVDARAVSPGIVLFIDKNVKSNPGKTSIKFNITEPVENLKLSL